MTRMLREEQAALEWRLKTCTVERFAYEVGVLVHFTFGAN